MKFYKEWRAVGIDVGGDGLEDRDERSWIASKRMARNDASELAGNDLPYDRIILERRKVGVPVEVKT